MMLALALWACLIGVTRTGDPAHRRHCCSSPSPRLRVRVGPTLQPGLAVPDPVAWGVLLGVPGPGPAPPHKRLLVTVTVVAAAAVTSTSG